MFVNYRILTPEANAAPILWRAVRALAGSGMFEAIGQVAPKSNQTSSRVVQYVQEARTDLILTSGSA